MAQVPRFSVTAAVRSAQLAGRRLNEARARRRREREDYVLITCAYLRILLQICRPAGQLLVAAQADDVLL